MLFIRMGWVEPKDRSVRGVRTMLEYRPLREEEYQTLRQSSDYRHTPISTGPMAGALAALLQVSPFALLARGTGFGSQDLLEKDQVCEFTLGAPVGNLRPKFLGRLEDVRFEPLGGKFYRATLKPQAVHQADFRRLQLRVANGQF